MMIVARPKAIPLQRSHQTRSLFAALGYLNPLMMR